MTEVPISIKDFSINIQDEGKKYEIILSQKSNNLLIFSKDLNNLKRYDKNLLQRIYIKFLNFLCNLIIFQKLKKINSLTNHQK